MTDISKAEKTLSQSYKEKKGRRNVCISLWGSSSHPQLFRSYRSWCIPKCDWAPHPTPSGLRNVAVSRARPGKPVYLKDLSLEAGLTWRAWQYLWVTYLLSLLYPVVLSPQNKQGCAFHSLTQTLETSTLRKQITRGAINTSKRHYCLQCTVVKTVAVFLEVKRRKEGGMMPGNYHNLTLLLPLNGPTQKIP